MFGAPTRPTALAVLLGETGAVALKLSHQGRQRARGDCRGWAFVTELEDLGSGDRRRNGRGGERGDDLVID